MSVAVPPAAASTAAGAPAARPSLARLTKVELRKMTDTRAGFWLLLTTAGLVVAIVATIGFAGDPPDHTLDSMFGAALAPPSVLLPVIGILLVTSEWTQRTSLITFALVPRRERVLAAKLLAGTVLGVVAFLLCLVVAAAGTLLFSPDVDDAWSLPLGLLAQSLLAIVTAMATGIGFGAMLLVSAPAIVLYFAAPMVFGILGALSFFSDAAAWVDASRALAPLTEELMSGTQWARAMTALALWMVVPLAIGLWRFMRGEVR